MATWLISHLVVKKLGFYFTASGSSLYENGNGEVFGYALEIGGLSI